MQDAAEAEGRSNDKRKVLGCVTWEKLVPSPFFTLYCGSAVLDTSLGSWRAPTLGAHLAEMAGVTALLPSPHPQRAVCSPLGQGKGVHFQKPFGKGAEGFVSWHLTQRRESPAQL